MFTFKKPDCTKKIVTYCVSDPGYQSGVANDIGVERSTVSRTFSSVLDLIVAKSEDWIKFSCTIEDMNKAKTD